ncbi:hypothetical protein HanXRQr2_Chr14g0628621 [Helianthus annuus]|uniref:Uncharacterized protein n=1 Tax=Helianthus annuus TaxID=4232 RepID=A0A9K3H591_HELAN|nr:hypothetical protein HanXRQr2_Chr14g0628621 [Helianthus annuus]KAJ0839099.1 hypothetical protein HanPSC8_Chr14g0602881 [Helianthus annuus]
MLSSQPVFFRDSSQLGFFSFTLSSSSFPPFITLLVKLFSPTNSVVSCYERGDPIEEFELGTG